MPTPYRSDERFEEEEDIDDGMAAPPSRSGCCSCCGGFRRKRRLPHSTNAGSQLPQPPDDSARRRSTLGSWFGGSVRGRFRLGQYRSFEDVSNEEGVAESSALAYRGDPTDQRRARAAAVARAEHHGLTEITAQKPRGPTGTSEVHEDAHGSGIGLRGVLRRSLQRQSNESNDGGSGVASGGNVRAPMPAQAAFGYGPHGERFSQDSVVQGDDDFAFLGNMHTIGSGGSHHHHHQHHSSGGRHRRNSSNLSSSANVSALALQSTSPFQPSTTRHPRHQRNSSLASTPQNYYGTASGQAQYGSNILGSAGRDSPLFDSSQRSSISSAQYVAGGGNVPQSPFQPQPPQPSAQHGHRRKSSMRTSLSSSSGPPMRRSSATSADSPQAQIPGGHGGGTKRRSGNTGPQSHFLRTSSSLTVETHPQDTQAAAITRRRNLFLQRKHYRFLAQVNTTDESKPRTDSDDLSSITAPCNDAALDIWFQGLGIDRYQPLKVLGRGDTGLVMLVRDKQPNDYGDEVCAVKIFDKKDLIRRQKVRRCLTEATVLASVDHPLLAKLYASFQTPERLYLAMAYCPGGELFRLVQSQPRGYLTESAARFYTAEVVLALEYLHLQGFVYRDLKPENILLQASGHVCLVDFDLVKATNQPDSSRATERKDGASKANATDQMLWLNQPEPEDEDGEGEGDGSRRGQRNLSGSSSRTLNAINARLRQQLSAAPAALNRLVKRSNSQNPPGERQDASDAGLQVPGRSVTSGGSEATSATTTMGTKTDTETQDSAGAATASVLNANVTSNNSSSSTLPLVPPKSPGRTSTPQGGIVALDTRSFVQVVANSFVGTAEYLAPEVITGEGHDSAVDWWSVGILLYEMLCGYTPFRGPNRTMTFANILRGRMIFPDELDDDDFDVGGGAGSPGIESKHPPISASAKDLIRSLVTTADRRLGSSHGAADLKMHRFFRTMDWNLIYNMEPPFRFWDSMPTAAGLQQELAERTATGGGSDDQPTAKELNRLFRGPASAADEGFKETPSTSTTSSTSKSKGGEPAKDPFASFVSVIRLP
eukprot:Clim_evm19s157 gene=Clim_evmTU19s157